MANHNLPQLTIAILAAPLLLAGCSPTPAPELPSDAELIKFFREHRDDLESLVSMLETDRGIVNIHEDGSVGLYDESYDNRTIDDARASKYLALVRRAGLSGQNVYSRVTQDSHVFEIFLWHWNSTHLSGATGIMKGYVYSTKEPGSLKAETHWHYPQDGPLKNSLDASNEGRPGPGQRWYRAIEGNWYLYVVNLHYDSHD